MVVPFIDRMYVSVQNNDKNTQNKPIEIVVVISHIKKRRQVYILMFSKPKEASIIMMTSSKGNIFRVPCEFPAQRPVTRSFDVFFDLRFNKRLGKQSWGWLFGRQCTHYDVSVMISTLFVTTLQSWSISSTIVRPLEYQLCTWKPHLKWWRFSRWLNNFTSWNHFNIPEYCSRLFWRICKKIRTRWHDIIEVFKIISPFDIDFLWRMSMVGWFLSCYQESLLYSFSYVLVWHW